MKRIKLYIVISVLIALMFFSIAAICNQCGIIPAASTTASATAESKASETVAEATSVKETTAETTSEETTEKTAAETTSSPKEAPTIKLQISEGPTFSAPDKICYYRVEAIVTGDPAPTVQFSKDDSSGAFGSKKVQVNLTKSSPSYTLTAIAKNSAGEAKDSITLNWGCAPVAVSKTIDFHPSDIGCVSPVAASTTEIAIGDDPSNHDMRGRFAFDVGALAGKEITSVKLKLVALYISPDLCNFKGNIVIYYNDFLPDITVYDYTHGTVYAGPETFAWDADPLQFSTDFLKAMVKERADSGVKLQFGIGYQNAATGGLPDTLEIRYYEKDGITLTVTYEE